MQDMKVKTSVEEGDKSFFARYSNYSCKCVAVSCFVTAIFFSLGAFVGTKYYQSDTQESSSGAGSPSGFSSGEFNAGTFDLGAMEMKARELRKFLEDYYKTKDSSIEKILKAGMGIDYGSKAYKESMKYVSKNFKRKLSNGGSSEFIIGVIGSSVAAGHDNCNFDSYERQMERLMQPVFKAASKNGNEIKFVVRNAGEGGSCGDTHVNQVYCVRQMVGDDVDLVHYSWTYFEGSEKGIPQHEQILRWSLMMRNEPSVHLFNAGGSKKGCYDDKDNQKLFKTYSKYGYNAICLEAALFGNGGYTGKEWGKVGDGVHSVARYGDYDPKKQCRSGGSGDYTERGPNGIDSCDFMGKDIDEGRKESLGVVWRNWHPGPLGFQLASDLFTYIYLESILQAIEDLKSVDSSEPSRHIPLMIDDLGSPLFCEKDECMLEEPPGCLNLEAPVYGYHQIGIVPFDDDLSPYYKGNPKPKPLYDQTKPASPANAGGFGWRRTYKAGEAQLIPKRERFYPECMHLDTCGFATAKKVDQSWLVLKLPKMTIGRVIVCGCCGKKVGEEMFIDNEFLEIQFDGKTLDRSTFEVFPNEKCAKVLDHFPESVNDETGHLYLAMRYTKDPTDSDQFVQLSHVIAY